MGKTVPSYRMALKEEILRWKKFRDALPSDEEKALFDEIIDYCRNNAMASQNTCNPILFEPMTISILWGCKKTSTAGKQYKKNHCYRSNNRVFYDQPEHS
jgi:hypothetical protein